jgi:DNA-binding LacI/PurR family transcriptional regulator
LTNIHDVARRAGVSPQTVSNVLNGRHARTSQQTRLRVLRAVKVLGYHPNSHARGLRQGRSQTLAYLTIDPGPSFLADPGRSGLLAGVGDFVRDHDYCLLVQSLPPDDPAERFRRLFRQRRFDGAVIEIPKERVGGLIRGECPCVLVEEHRGGRRTACVRADDRGGAVQVVNYLLAQGHRRVDLLTVQDPWPNMRERMAGYLSAMKAHPLPVPRRMTAISEHVEPARAVMEKALRRDKSLTAVFCINDILALGALQAAKAVGRNVPGELAVVGFGDFAFSQYVEPPLTTVILPKYDMGRRAAELLLGYLQNGRFEETDVVYPTRLVNRGSA